MGPVVATGAPHPFRILGGNNYNPAHQSRPMTTTTDRSETTSTRIAAASLTVATTTTKVATRDKITQTPTTPCIAAR